jgi:tripartite-type tricarboxylate transporter receptor subunit TctC
MRILLAFLILLGVTNAALAHSWPSRPLRLVIPFAPGGGADIASRVIGQEISVLVARNASYCYPIDYL